GGERALVADLRRAAGQQGEEGEHLKEPRRHRGPRPTGLPPGTQPPSAIPRAVRPGVAYAPGVLPTALAIGGLDPSGGAGPAADPRAFDAAGAWGAPGCAALTVQSTRGVRRVQPVPAALVLEQAREVLADARVRALKTGALGSAANARAVAALLADHPAVPSV